MKTLTSKRLNCRNQKKISIWNKKELKNKQLLFLKKGNGITQLHEENGLRPRENKLGVVKKQQREVKTQGNSRKLMGGGQVWETRRDKEKSRKAVTVPR